MGISKTINSRFFYVVCVLLIAYALFNVSSQNLLGNILFCLVSIALAKTWNGNSDNYDKKISLSSSIFSFAISLFLLIGKSFNADDNLKYITDNPIKSVFLLFGCWLFFYIAVGFLISYFGQVLQKHTNQSPSNSIISFLVDNHPFAVPFIFLLLFWLPYWIIHFPGNIFFDGFAQLNYYFGVWEWHDHHPVFASLVFGFLMQLGRTIGDDNLGMFFIVLIQYLLNAFSCAYAMLIMKRWNTPGMIRVCILLFWALNPNIVLWLSIACKDTFALGMTLLFSAIFCEIVRREKNGLPHRAPDIALCVIGVILALFRKQNLYIVMGSLIMLVIFLKSVKQRIYWSTLTALCLIGAVSVSAVLVDILHARPASIAEALSVPFQQTARYVRDHGDEITQQERDAIDAVLDYEFLAEGYRSEVSDPVKATYKGNGKALFNYLGTWFSMFLKHPMTYLEATISNSYHYYSLNGGGGDAMGATFIVDDYSNETGFFNLYHPLFSSEFTDKVRQSLNELKNIPCANLLFEQSPYTWFLLLLILILYKRKRYVYLICFSPAILTVISCIVSPVNGYARYFVPVMVMLPLMLAWTFCALLNAENALPEKPLSGRNINVSGSKYKNKRRNAKNKYGLRTIAERTVKA